MSTTEDARKHLEAGRSEVSRYLVVIERGQRNYSAFVPDLPGCVATGKTRRELLRNMQGAIEMHLEGLLEDGLEVPQATTDADWIEVRLRREGRVGVGAPPIRRIAR